MSHQQPHKLDLWTFQGKAVFHVIPLSKIKINPINLLNPTIKFIIHEVLVYPNVRPPLLAYFDLWWGDACLPAPRSRFQLSSHREGSEGEKGGTEGTAEESGKRHCRVITCREPLAHSAVHCEWLRMPDHHGTLEKEGRPPRRQLLTLSLTQPTKSGPEQMEGGRGGVKSI